MKRIPYVADVIVTDLQGEVMKNDGKEITIEQCKFFLQRMGDTKFTTGKEGMEAAEFVLEARKELMDQEKKIEEVKARGYWLLEDERAKALKEVVLHPSVSSPGPGQAAIGYVPGIQHNLVPFGKSIKEMVDDTEAKKKEMDGANTNAPL